MAISGEAKRWLIEPGHPQLSIRRQCALLGLARWRLYYQPVSESVENVQLISMLIYSLNTQQT